LILLNRIDLPVGQIASVAGLPLVEPDHDGEYPFKKVPARFMKQRASAFVVLMRNEREEKRMRKFAYILAAATAMAVATPTIASAEGFGFRIGGNPEYCAYHYCGPRFGFYGHDRDYHRYYRDYDRDRGVVIRHYDPDDD
jgi:hypothetical protein